MQVRLLEPMVLVGRQVDDTTFELPAEDEMDVVGPVLNERMQEQEQEQEPDEDQPPS